MGWLVIEAALPLPTSHPHGCFPCPLSSSSPIDINRPCICCSALPPHLHGRVKHLDIPRWTAWPKRASSCARTWKFLSHRLSRLPIRPISQHTHLGRHGNPASPGWTLSNPNGPVFPACLEHLHLPAPCFKLDHRIVSYWPWRAGMFDRGHALTTLCVEQLLWNPSTSPDARGAWTTVVFGSILVQYCVRSPANVKDGWDAGHGDVARTSRSPLLC